MAAIISQMAANKRARQRDGTHSCVSSDKCVYTLPPFDPCFDPLVHNKYMRSVVQKQMVLEEEKFRRHRDITGINNKFNMENNSSIKDNNNKLRPANSQREKTNNNNNNKSNSNQSSLKNKNNNNISLDAPSEDQVDNNSHKNPAIQENNDNNEGGFDTGNESDLENHHQTAADSTCNNINNNSRGTKNSTKDNKVNNKVSPSINQFEETVEEQSAGHKKQSQVLFQDSGNFERIDNTSENHFEEDVIKLNANSDEFDDEEDVAKIHLIEFPTQCRDEKNSNGVQKVSSSQKKKSGKTSVLANSSSSAVGNHLEKNSGERVLSEIFSGCAILFIGASILAALTFYIWVMLWNVKG